MAENPYVRAETAGVQHSKNGQKVYADLILHSDPEAYPKAVAVHNRLD